MGDEFVVFFVEVLMFLGFLHVFLMETDESLAIDWDFNFSGEVIIFFEFDSQAEISASKPPLAKFLD
jgi:hypothetical protein